MTTIYYAYNCILFIFVNVEVNSLSTNSYFHHDQKKVLKVPYADIVSLLMPVKATRPTRFKDALYTTKCTERR